MRTNLFLVLLLISFVSFSQEKEIKIMFYNVENLYDTQNDPKINDDEFTPTGARNWTEQRFQKKIASISQVITAIGGWTSPEIICLSEIENREVLEKLKESAKLQDYEILHKESSDPRGIDVAMIYNKNKVNLITSEFIPIVFQDSSHTRDILYAKIRLENGDSIHLFANHWPSRFGGYAVSEDRRIEAANTLLKKMNSIKSVEAYPKFVIIGDLNDYVGDRSISQVLQVKSTMDEKSEDNLYDLLTVFGFEGTHKNQDKWGILDHIIVSGMLLKGELKTCLFFEKTKVFNEDFLLEKDEKYKGKRPFRTFSGYIYKGGFSDHLPIYLTLKLK